MLSPKYEKCSLFSHPSFLLGWQKKRLTVENLIFYEIVQNMSLVWDFWWNSQDSEICILGASSKRPANIPKFR